MALDRRSEDSIPVFQSPIDGVRARGTVVAKVGRFVKILSFFVDNPCQALLADQLGSYSMAAGFDNLSTKENTTKNLRNHQIFIEMKQ